MKAKARPRLDELRAAAAHALRGAWQDERRRARRRLIAVVLACALVGVIGPTLKDLLSATACDTLRNCEFHAWLFNSPEPMSVEAGTAFTARWHIVNRGTSVWDNAMSFRHTDGSIVEATQVISATETIPDAIFSLTVEMTAPQAPGTYLNTWRMFTPQNEPFGPLLTVAITSYPAGTLQPPPPAAPLQLPFDVWYVAPAMVGIVISLLRSGQFITQMYSLKSARHGLMFALSAIFGLGGIRITVRDGEVERPEVGKDRIEPDEVANRIGGPGKLSVKADSAALTERGGGFARMIGPDDYSLATFERIRLPFDLRTQSFSDTTEFALTKDGIPVRVRVSTRFKFTKRMEGDEAPASARPGFRRLLRALLGRPIRPDERAGLSNLLPVSPEALRQAAYELPAGAIWNKAAHGTISGSVRAALAQRMLDQLFAPDNPSIHPRREIQEKVFEDGKAALAKRGIELLDIHFGNIVAPDEVVEQRRWTWQVNWEKESTIIQAAGEADGLIQYQRARVEAQTELIQAVTHAIRTLDQTSEQSEMTHPLALRFMDVVARTVDHTLYRTSKNTASQDEVNKALKRLREVLKKESSRTT